MNDDLSGRLEYRTWLQLRECTLLAMTALEQISGTRGLAVDETSRVNAERAGEALEKIKHVLSEEWEGPGSTP